MDLDLRADLCEHAQMLALSGSPYEVPSEVEDSLLASVRELERRVALLRGQQLTPETLDRYYKTTRLQDVTESNAIEGSTLSLHETELAVMKGTTLTGHDPGYIRDAKALFAAFERLAELAREKKPTDIAEVKELHELLLGERVTAGQFRTVPVRIGGANHKPPATWALVMQGMEEWEGWSRQNPELPAPLRAAVLHAWLAHIHPFVDGNGRTARAITTLELVRAGYPPPIIRRKDRHRYYDALAQADEGDLAPLLELLLGRSEDALRDLERAAKAAQGYNPAVAALRQKQTSQLAIWNKAVDLLVATISATLLELRDHGVEASVRTFGLELELDDYVSLCSEVPISDAWAFEMRLNLPGSRPISRLAWIGFRSAEMVQSVGASGPTLFWSVANPQGVLPRWRRASQAESPGGEEITYSDDGWLVKRGGTIDRLSTPDLAARVARETVKMA